MKISVLCDNATMQPIADEIAGGMYNIHGTEAKTFVLPNVDLLYLQAADMVVAVCGEACFAIKWLEESYKALGLSDIAAAAFFDKKENEYLLGSLSELGFICDKALVCSQADSAMLRDFGSAISKKAAQHVGQWSLDFD